MLSPYLKKLILKQNLTLDECQSALDQLLTGKNPEQIAAFLVLMRAKGETVQELSAFVQGLRKTQRTLTVDFPILDIVGTGGDGADTANISTAASILAASCGVKVVKHGNRASSSQAGSADVLEALGLSLDQTAEQIQESILIHGIGFCFAQQFLPGLQALKSIRKQLHMPTLFNLIGPLLNPAKPDYIILGVFEPGLMPLMADSLINLGVKRSLVVHGNGLDELNCLGPCQVIEIKGSDQLRYTIDPESLGLSLCGLNELKGGDARENARLLHEVFTGKPSPLADTICLNAAAALYLYGKSESLQSSLYLAQKSIKTGAAQQTLSEFIRGVS